MKKLFIVLGGLTAYATFLGVLVARATTVWEVLGCVVSGFFVVAAGVVWLTPPDSAALGRVAYQPPRMLSFLGRPVAHWSLIDTILMGYGIETPEQLEDHLRKAQGLPKKVRA